jgi:hypothetical protein
MPTSPVSRDAKRSADDFHADQTAIVKDFARFSIEDEVEFARHGACVGRKRV